MHKEVWTKFRNVLLNNGVPIGDLETIADKLAHSMQQGYQTSGEIESGVIYRSPIEKGKQAATLSNAQLDTNHPEHIGQQLDDAGNYVHTKTDGSNGAKTRLPKRTRRKIYMYTIQALKANFLCLR